MNATGPARLVFVLVSITIDLSLYVANSIMICRLQPSTGLSICQTEELLAPVFSLSEGYCGE